MSTDIKKNDKRDYVEKVMSMTDARFISEAESFRFEKRRTPVSTWIAAACFALFVIAAAILLIKPLRERPVVIPANSSEPTASPTAAPTVPPSKKLVFSEGNEFPDYAADVLENYSEIILEYPKGNPCFEVEDRRPLAAKLLLPKGWTVENGLLEDIGYYPLDEFVPYCIPARAGNGFKSVYNENGECVGTIGLGATSPDYPGIDQAFDVTFLDNGPFFLVGKGGYVLDENETASVSSGKNGEAFTLRAHYSEDKIELALPAIISYDTEFLVGIVMEFGESAVTNEQLTKIAESVRFALLMDSSAKPIKDLSEYDFSDHIIVDYPTDDINHGMIAGVHDIEPFSVSFILPEGWKVIPFRPYENRIYLMGWDPESSPMNCLKWLADENGNCVGAFGFGTHKRITGVPPEDYHKAVYASLRGTGAKIDIDNFYTPVESSWDNITALSMARYSASSYLDAYIPGSPDIDNPAILSYLDSRRVYFAMELDSSVDESIVNEIAQSIFILDVKQPIRSGIRETPYGYDAVIDALFDEFHDIALMHGIDIVKETVGCLSGSRSPGYAIQFHDSTKSGYVHISLNAGDDGELHVDYANSHMRFKDNHNNDEGFSFEIEPTLGNFSSVTDPAIGETIASRIVDFIMTSFGDDSAFKMNQAKAISVRPIVMEEGFVKYEITLALMPKRSRTYICNTFYADSGLYDGAEFPECKGWFLYSCEADAILRPSGEWECTDIFTATHGD